MPTQATATLQPHEMLQIRQSGINWRKTAQAQIRASRCPTGDERPDRCHWIAESLLRALDLLDPVRCEVRTGPSGLRLCSFLRNRLPQRQGLHVAGLAAPARRVGARVGGRDEGRYLEGIQKSAGRTSLTHIML